MYNISVNKLKSFCFKTIAVILCIGSFVSMYFGVVFARNDACVKIVPQSASGNSVDGENVPIEKALDKFDFEKTSDTDLKEALDELEKNDEIKQAVCEKNSDLEPKEILDEKLSVQEQKIPEGKARKFGRFVINWGVWLLLLKLVPSFDWKQSDLKFVQFCTRSYVFRKFSMDICRMLGLSDKKQYDYTPRNIRKKAVNLLIRLGSMIALNRIVSKCNVVEKMIDSYYKDDIKKRELFDYLHNTHYAKTMKDNIKSIKVSLYYLKLAPCREIAKRIPSLFGC